MSRRICEAYGRMGQLTSLQAKMKYISVWEQLAGHGIVYFAARFQITHPLLGLLNSDSTEHSHVPWLHKQIGGRYLTLLSSSSVEALGIGPTRIFRCDLSSGQVRSSWRLSAIQEWDINWELGQMVLILAPLPTTSPAPEGTRTASPQPNQSSTAEQGGRIIIRPVDVSVRTVAEFLGGYTFLSHRSPEKNQCLDESSFYRLTTGHKLPLMYSTVG